MDNIQKPYLYEMGYIQDIEDFKQKVLNKAFIPHQVELQPGPKGRKICWLECEYCYGKSAINTDERLSLSRYLEIIDEIVSGGCRKFIFAGWATDPLFYNDIFKLVSRAVLNEAVIGFNTRAINISDRLMGLISSDKVQPLSYMSISVNAATNEKYKFVNGAGDTRVPLYDKVLENVRKLCASVKRNKSHLDVSVSYLVNQFTSNEEDIEKFIVDFKSAEVDLIRFSCPQVPRGSELANNLFIPSLQEYQKYFEDIQAIVNKYKSDKTAILVLPHLAEYDVSRTMPCFARFIYPTVGYDGWLYHCSQSAGVNFRSQALGNLETNSFWECLYNYDATDLDEYFQSIQKKMCANNCRCDRKEHTVNAALRSNFF